MKNKKLEEQLYFKIEFLRGDIKRLDKKRKKYYTWYNDFFYNKRINISYQISGLYSEIRSLHFAIKLNS